MEREPDYGIRRARPADVPRIAAIELAAARLLVGHAPARVLGETTRQDVLHEARRLGHLWVATAADVPVGFAHVAVREHDRVHLEEIDVHPDHGRRGLGTALVKRVCAWTCTNGYSAVTLTTFRGVPWNFPFYARLGFVEVLSHESTPALSAIVREEAGRGLDPARRVVMLKPCAARGAGDARGGGG